MIAMYLKDPLLLSYYVMWLKHVNVFASCSSIILFVKWPGLDLLHSVCGIAPLFNLAGNAENLYYLKFTQC